MVMVPGEGASMVKNSRTKTSNSVTMGQDGSAWQTQVVRPKKKYACLRPPDRP